MLLEHRLKRDWPSELDLKEKRVIRPDITDTIHSLLNKDRVCTITGPPRCGKTTLACLAGWESVTGKKVSRFRHARYIDLAELTCLDDVSDIISMGKSWLLILDNWHVAPDYHNALIKRIKTDWSDVGCLIVATEFASGDVESELQSYLTSQIRELHITTIVDVSEWTNMIATGMIERHIQQLLKAKDTCKGEQLISLAISHNLRFDLEDYKQTIGVAITGKKVRSNLRLLHWRLQAWKPVEVHLRDVQFTKIIEEVKRTIVIPSSDYIGTMERIAAVAQWELPFLRAPGQNPPDGIAALQKKNLVVTMESMEGWRMDSTDAYLLMLATSEDLWLHKGTALLREYVRAHVSQATHVIRNVLIQGSPDTQTALIVTLLEEPTILEAEKKYLIALADSDGITFGGFRRIIDCLMRDFPSAQEEIGRRLKILSVLSCPEIAGPLGKSARNVSIASLRWFLWKLEKGREHIVEFVQSFLEGYGEDYLLILLSNAPWKDRRSLINVLGHYNAPLSRKFLRLEASRKISFEEVSLSRVTRELMQTTVISGPIRRNMIGALSTIDEDYLISSLARKPQFIGQLQSIINSSLWLSGDQAWRLAKLVPHLWSTLGSLPDYGGEKLTSAQFEKLCYLIINCWQANRGAAQDFINIILKTPLDSLLKPEGATAINKFLISIERVMPGAINKWCLLDIEYLSSVISLLDDETLDELLAVLAVFAPDALSKILEASHPRIFATANDNSLLRFGVLSICGKAKNVRWRPDVPTPEETAHYGSISFLVALYGLQLSHGLGVVQNLLSLLPDVDNLSPWTPLRLARYPLPWNPIYITEMANKSLQIEIDPRTDAQYNMILLGMMLDNLEWMSDFAFDSMVEGHKALQNAIHENIFRIELDRDHNVVRASINSQNRIVHAVDAVLRTILQQLSNSSLHIKDWDDSLPNLGTLSRIDYFRAKLIRAGVVTWSITTERDQVMPKFSISVNKRPSMFYEMNGIGSSINLDRVTANLKSWSTESINQQHLFSLIRFISVLEDSHPLLSLSKLNAEFQDKGEMRDSLQTAIDIGILHIYYVDNPENQAFPIIACQLNAEHPLVKEAKKRNNV